MSDRPMHTVPGAWDKLVELFARGDAAIQEGRFHDAIEAFTEGLAIDDHFRQRYVTMYAQRGFARQRSGDLAGAAEDYGHAIAMEPPVNQAQYHFYRGMCRGGLGDPEGAVEDYAASIALHPDHPGPYHLRAKLLVNELGRYAEAIPDLDRLIAMNGHPEGLELRGYARLMLGDPAAARRDVEDAADRQPTPWRHYLVAWATALVGDADAFMPAMAAALEGNPDYAPYFREHGDFAAMRADPRFAGIIDG
ncbi:MAG: tetratricopeptide repeat protein [Myxococcales bacterium]|nr:tetratricopeptide repeat protein [Myxococcales bacterium]MCB9737115.1 tetratricopeptide repeat protein [Deltaproteobacteria bacterium]